MSARPHRLHLLVILLAAALPATSSWSASIGALQVHSFLGQPLLATVTLNLSEDENLTMLDCIRTQGTDNDLAGPGQLRQELFVSGDRATVHLRGIEPLNEPMIGMSFSVGCNESPQIQRSFILLLDPAPVTEVQPAVITASSITASSNAQPVTTPTSIARPIRPVPVRAKRVVAASKPVNSAPSTAPIQADAALGNSSSAPPQRDDASYRLKIESASATEIRSEELESELQVLQNQHAQLRVEMNRLEERMARLQLQLEGPSLPAPLVARAPAIEASAPPATSPRRLWPWIFGGGLTAILLATAAWLLARRDDDPVEENDWLNRPMTPTELDVDTLSRNKVAPPRPEEGIEVADDDSELDQAQFLLSEGQALEAIDLLYSVIDKDPSEVRAWLLLLRTLSQRDNSQEFAMVTERFKTTSPNADDWAIVQAMGRDLDPENPLYAPTPQVRAESVKGQPTLNFFVDAHPAPEPTPVPKLDLGLESLPEEPTAGDSTINQISRRDAA